MAEWGQRRDEKKLCRAHVSSHFPLAKTSRLITHNPTDYFKRKTDCQQSTPTKATLAKKRLLKTPDPQIGSSVIAFDKDKQRKVFSVNFRIWARGFKHMRRQIDNLDQYLSIDNFPLSGLQVKVVYKTNLVNVLERD